MSNGRLVASSVLTMNSQQKSFSVALGRQMVPRSHILVYAIVNGEVVMDAFTFFVRDSNINNVSLIILMSYVFPLCLSFFSFSVLSFPLSSFLSCFLLFLSCSLLFFLLVLSLFLFLVSFVLSSNTHFSVLPCTSYFVIRFVQP